MLISDVFEIPHEKLADWLTLIGSAIVYFLFAMLAFYGLRMFVRRTQMRLLGNLMLAMVLIAGLAGYFAVWVALDSVAISRVYAAALPNVAELHHDPQLARLSKERARSILAAGGPMEQRRIGFYLLPVLAVVLAAMTVRRA